MSNTINAKGLALIKEFEGCKLTAYKDSVGVWTIGYGHTGKVDGKAICSGMTITQAKANSLLKDDCQKFADYVDNSSYVPVTEKLNTYQRDALISFAFNVGQGNLKTLCAGRTVAEIGEKITAYNKAGGAVLAGLTRRRKAEQVLYKTALYRYADPAEGKEVVPGRKTASMEADVKCKYSDGTKLQVLEIVNSKWRKVSGKGLNGKTYEAYVPKGRLRSTK